MDQATVDRLAGRLAREGMAGEVNRDTLAEFAEALRRLPSEELNEVLCTYVDMRLRYLREG
jgi:hypothetical protein